MKRAVSMVLAIFLSIGLISCSKNKVNLESVDIILPDGLPAVGLSKFIDENTSSEGSNFNISLQNTPDVLVAELLKGDAEIAIVPSNLALQTYKKNLDYRIAGTVGWGSMYLISIGEVQNLSELEGAEIYNTGKGLTPDIICRQVLDSKGIDDSKVNYSYVSAASELAPMIIGGKAKVAVVPEPILSTVLSKKPDTKILLKLNSEWKTLKNVERGYPQSTILIKESFYKENKKICNDILNRIDKSINWVVKNPSEVADICEKNSITANKAILDKALERSNLKYYGIQDTKEEYKVYFDSIDNSAKEQEGKIDYEKIFIEGQ